MHKRFGPSKPSPRRVAPDDDGNETGSAIATVPVAGGKLTYLTTFKEFAHFPDWNPLTGSIVYTPAIREFQKDVNMADETWDVFVVEPDVTGSRQVTKAADGEQFKGAKWTPDGSAILAWSSRVGVSPHRPRIGNP